MSVARYVLLDMCCSICSACYHKCCSICSMYLSSYVLLEMLYVRMYLLYVSLDMFYVLVIMSVARYVLPDMCCSISVARYALHVIISVTPYALCTCYHKCCLIYIA